MMMRILIAIISIITPAVAFAAGPTPPPDLVQLEREVSLKMAHARDEGFIDASRRKTLADAQAVDAEGEKALKAGEFERAEDDFLKAKVLLHNLGI
jgi:hypothetical protein